jgi:HSP90 family molecular chaperone
MIKTKKRARNFSAMFNLLSIVGDYNKALTDNPDANKKETLREIKKKVIQKKSEKDEKNNLTQNEQTMKRIIQQTKELISMIDEEVKIRKKFYATHGDRWQDSDKGRAYCEETDLLNEMLNQLNDSICELATV